MQQNLDSQGVVYCCCERQNVFSMSTQWIQINWWIPAQHNFNPPDEYKHVSIPPELIRTNYVQWIPAKYIDEIAFIFHIDDILHGKYLNTHGLKNVYFSRSILDAYTNRTLESASPLPYFEIFGGEVENHANRVWGVIERVQQMLLKAMGRRGKNQKLHYTESSVFTKNDWILVKSRFNKDIPCLFTYTGDSTVHRYGIGLSQETIKRRSIEKEIIVIENTEMLQQVISAFGTCACSTVRARFPKGPILTRGSKRGSTVKQLKKSDKVNSITKLSNNSTASEDVEYSSRRKERGFDFRYDFGSRKFSIAVRYNTVLSTDNIITSFYGRIDYEQEHQNQENNIQMISGVTVNSHFEAFDSLFIVVSITQNNVRCQVVEAGEDETYNNESEHTFSIAFVRHKINEYLS